MKSVRMFDYLNQYQDIEQDILSAIVDVFRSGNLILGEQVESFERNFSQYLGKGEAVAVNSGTDALLVALMALGIGDGDEVITVSNTAVPTVSAIRMAGATPVFCDVDCNTALMDVDLLKGCITNKTKAIVAVHLFGNVVDIDQIREIIKGKNISIIEDCAQAHGAAIDRKKVGALGDVSAFSFYPTKNLGAYGDAGLCYSSDHLLIKEMKKIRMYGFHKSYYSEREGINSRMDEVQAAILNVKLPYLNTHVDKRRKLATLYNELLSSRIARISVSSKVDPAYHLYVIKISDRELVRSNLLSKGIQTGVHYPYPIHLMSGYNFLGYTEGTLPNTERLAKEVLSLPLYPGLDESAVYSVCDVLNSIA